MKHLKAKVSLEVDTQKHISEMHLEGDTIGVAMLTGIIGSQIAELIAKEEHCPMTVARSRVIGIIAETICNNSISDVDKTIIDMSAFK